MSNKLINAVIALIEDRPEDARAMLRSPEVKDLSVSEVQGKLYAALDVIKDHAVKKALRDVLNHTIKLGQKDGRKIPEDSYEAYVQGIVEVENIIDSHIKRLEP